METDDRLMTIAEFCRWAGISLSYYPRLRARGLGPREIRIGTCIRIGHEARLDWVSQRENPSGQEAREVAASRRRLWERSHKAAARSAHVVAAREQRA